MLKFKMGWLNPSQDVTFAISSRIRLARNLAEHPFPNRGSSKDLDSTLGEVFEAAKKMKKLAKSAYLKLQELDTLDRRFLMERHLISHELTRQTSGRGVIIGENEIVSLMVNEEDHIRLQGMSPGINLSGIWNDINELDNELGKRLSFAFDARWGYLTACPTNAGTGLRASYLIHLPALTLNEQINPVLEGLSRLGIVARGLYGEGTRVVGNLYQISNATSMGHKEEEIIDTLERIIKNLIQHEKRSRQTLVTRFKKAATEDRIFRSLGILTHARAVSFEEAMHHISNLQLGLSLEFSIPVSLEILNELLILIQPAHVQMTAGREMEAAERDVSRAALIRKKIQGE